eukprot:457543-Rhodomonas_salina.1
MMMMPRDRFSHDIVRLRYGLHVVRGTEAGLRAHYAMSGTGIAYRPSAYAFGTDSMYPPMVLLRDV